MTGLVITVAVITVAAIAVAIIAVAIIAVIRVTVWIEGNPARIQRMVDDVLGPPADPEADAQWAGHLALFDLTPDDMRDRFRDQGESGGAAS